MNAPREYLPFAIAITKTVAIVTSVLYTDVPRFARPKISWGDLILQAPELRTAWLLYPNAHQCLTENLEKHGSRPTHTARSLSVFLWSAIRIATPREPWRFMRSQP